MNFQSNPKKNLTLVWSDEFDNGCEPSKLNWKKEIWKPSVVNEEKQNYVDTKETAYVSNSTLKIKAIKKNEDWYSARLTSHNLHFFKYGYFEASIKLPRAKGVWPAFWMMPNDSIYGNWPRSGEIDIMEYSPSTLGEKVFATLHHSSSDKDLSIDKYESLGEKILDISDSEFHTYGINWTERSFEFFIDDISIGKKYMNDEKGFVNWPYDKDFFIILNLAIGGTLGGEIDNKLVEAVVEIDYVRVYQSK